LLVIDGVQVHLVNLSGETAREGDYEKTIISISIYISSISSICV